MRIALLSDLHGNEVALDAVLSDVFEKGVDRIVCLGDTAALGPRPRAVLARLRDLGCPCILGNHDAFMLQPSLIHSYNDASSIVQAVDWCRSQLSQADLDFIARFAPSLTIELTDDKQLLLFHGSPRSYMEDLLCTTPPEALDAMLSGQRAAVMAGGHTHIQMLRQHQGMLLVNPGSVGMAFERYVSGKVPTLLPHGEWACVEAKQGKITVSLHRVELDRRALRSAAGSVEHPLAAWLRDQYA